MEPSDIIQLSGIIVALITGIISIIISIKTLRQNSKMIEDSTRPVISIYSEYINPGIPQFYIVVKNFGQTQAIITKFDYNFDFVNNQAYPISNNKKDYLKDLVTASLAPGQSKICCLDYAKINTPVTFSIEYKSPTKTYNEDFTINLKAGVAMVTSKSDTKDNDVLKTISYTLQEMLQKKL